MGKMFNRFIFAFDHHLTCLVPSTLVRQHAPVRTILPLVATATPRIRASRPWWEASRPRKTSKPFSSSCVSERGLSNKRSKEKDQKNGLDESTRLFDAAFLWRKGSVVRKKPRTSDVSMVLQYAKWFWALVGCRIQLRPPEQKIETVLLGAWDESYAHSNAFHFCVGDLDPTWPSTATVVPCYSRSSTSRCRVVSLRCC